MTYKECLDIAFRYADSERGDFDYPDMFWSLSDEAQKLIALNGRPIKRYLDIVTDKDNNKVTITKTGYAITPQITEISVSDWNSDMVIPIPVDWFEMAPEGITKEGMSGAVFYKIKNNTEIYLVPDGKYNITYHAIPTRITADTPDEYQYEVDEDTQVAIPYYIGYHLVGTDDETLYTMLKNQWASYLSSFSPKSGAVFTKMRNVYGR